MYFQMLGDMTVLSFTTVTNLNSRGEAHEAHEAGSSSHDKGPIAGASSLTFLGSPVSTT